MLLKYLIPGKGNYSFENRLLQRGHTLCPIIKFTFYSCLIYFGKQNLEFWKNTNEVNININKY